MPLERAPAGLGEREAGAHARPHGRLAYDDVAGVLQDLGKPGRTLPPQSPPANLGPMTPRLRRIALTLLVGAALLAVGVVTAGFLLDNSDNSSRAARPTPSATGTPTPSPTDVTTVPLLNAPAACGYATGFTCSTLTVPLDQADPTGRTLDLAVATGDNQDAPRGALLLLTGGPGQPGVPPVARVAQLLGTVLDDYQLVMIDQRGTGATALDCPALQQQLGASDLWVPTGDAVTTCARSIGDDRRFYGTADTVADLELLRRRSTSTRGRSTGCPTAPSWPSSTRSPTPTR